MVENKILSIILYFPLISTIRNKLPISFERFCTIDESIDGQSAKENYTLWHSFEQLYNFKRNEYESFSNYLSILLNLIIYMYSFLSRIHSLVRTFTKEETLSE